MRNQTSTIDLTIVSSNITQSLNFMTHPGQCHSDHFPLVVQLLNNKQDDIKSQAWKIDKANWAAYNEAINLLFNISMHLPTLECVQKLEEQIINAATQAIPKTSINTTKRNVPWWNAEIHLAIKLRKREI